MIIESIEPLAGIQQISNSVFEGSATNVGIRMIGTSTEPIKFVFISNTYIAGEPSVVMDFARSINFDNCYFTCGTYGTNFQGESRDISYVNCDFQTLNVPFKANDGSKIDRLNFANPMYDGLFEFIFFPNIPITDVNNISITGGRIGNAFNQLSLNMPINISMDIPGYKKLNNYGNTVFNGMDHKHNSLFLMDYCIYLRMLQYFQQVETQEMQRYETFEEMKQTSLLT